MINKKFLLIFTETVAFLGIMGVFFFPFGASAESVFQSALNTLSITFANARKVVYFTAGFGLIGVAVAAISGKLPWRWLAMISVALFTLAVAEKITLYVTNTDTTSQMTSSFSVDAGDFKLNFGNDGTTRMINSVNSAPDIDSTFMNQLQN